jgi:CubicO group peptidase (beta-lactamase class C family)
MNTTQGLSRVTLSGYAQAGVEQGLFSGAAIGYSVAGLDHYDYSHTVLPGSQTPFSGNTLFDIASITKSILSVAVMQFIERGDLLLSTPVTKFISTTGKGWDKITIQHLLANSFKLDFNTELYLLKPQEIRSVITSSNLVSLNNGLHYHNHNALLLGWLVEQLMQKPLAQVLRHEILEPAEMKNTFFFSEIPHGRMKDVHPSFNEKLGSEPIVGMPHDQISYQFAHHGQVVGCAGIFSTAPDMIRFGKYTLRRAFMNPEKIFGLMLKNYHAAYGRTWGLGFDKHLPDYICPCFAEQTLVMTGFTGCSIWIQPSHEKVLTILSNGTYPVSEKQREKGVIGLLSPLREYRQTLATELFYCKHCME